MTEPSILFSSLVDSVASSKVTLKGDPLIICFSLA